MISENENVVEHAVLSRLSSYLSCETIVHMNRISFSTNILTDHVRNKRGQQFRYKVVQCNNKGLFDISNGITNCVILVKLKYSYVNVNHSVSITGSSVFEYNYKRALPMMRESKEIIFIRRKIKK